MKTKSNKIDKFFELSIEAFESDNESVYEEIGLSKDEYLNNKLNMIKRIKMKTLAQLNKAKNENLLFIALQKIQQVISSSNDAIKIELEKLILASSPQFQFRNLDKLDENDLKELLSDLDVLKLIEDLEKFDSDNE